MKSSVLNKILKGALLTTTALGVFTVVVGYANAANIALFTGPSGNNPANIPGNVPDLNALANEVNAGITSQSVAAFSTVRNFLDNGDFNIAQRGTAAIAGSTTTVVGKNPPGATNGYVADRWAINTNVSAGAGKGQVVTSSPTPLQGFVNALNVWRDSGALTQQVCATQEIPTTDSISLQGQQVTFSVWLQALANLGADNGNIVSMSIITGTGSDEGMGSSFTAAPAVTPAWTGIATLVSTNKTITTSWARYSVTGTIATSVKEIGVQICMQPNKSASPSGSSTDGFSMDGAQLEQGSTASSFAYLPLGLELTKAQQYFFRLNEPATSQTVLPIVGMQNTSQVCAAGMALPTTMRAAPVYTNQLTGTTFAIIGTKVTIAAAVQLSGTFSAVQGANTTTFASFDFGTIGGAQVAGDTCELMSKAAGGVIDLSAEF